MRAGLGTIVGLSILIMSASFSVAHAGNTVQYTYDALGRVTEVWFGDGSWIQYSYDAAGNRTQVKTSPNTNLNAFTWSSTATCPVNCWGTTSTW